MLDAFKQRVVIFGNSGSGKSTLAERLAAISNVPTIDLDLLHWEGEGYGAKREEAAARQMAMEAAAKPTWIVEGVFGWLAEIATPRATALIWLDMPWKLCRDGLLARGRRRGGTDADFSQLMAWAEAYWDRRTSSSFFGHLRLFEQFPHVKLRLRSYEDADRLLDDIRGERAAS